MNLSPKNADRAFSNSVVQNSAFDRTGGKHFYDIKGNTFKNTLVPKEAAHANKAKRYRSPLERAHGNMPDIHLNKVQAKHHEREKRSGNILFGNIN